MGIAQQHEHPLLCTMEESWGGRRQL